MPNGVKAPLSPQDANALFDSNYYQTGLGPPYERSAHWLNFFGTIADEIIRSLRPKTVLDAGCALGFLVESLWDRGVEAFGIDISEFAISQVRRDIQPYCRRTSIVEPIEGHYDLIACIEVLEHLLPEQSEAAIANIAGATDTILFSSTPTDISEATHFNVRPIIGWLNLFKDVGFWPDYLFDAGFVAPHALLLRKQVRPTEDGLVLVSENIRWKSAFVARDRQIAALSQNIADLQASTGKQEQIEQERARLSKEVQRLQELHNGVRIEVSDAHHAKIQVEQERDGLLEEKEEFNGLLNGVRTELSGVYSAKHQLEQEREVLSQERDRLQGHLDEIRIEFSGVQIAKSQLEQERESLSQEKDWLRGQLDEIQIAKGQLEQEREGLSQDKDRLRSQLDEVRTELSGAQKGDEELLRERQILAATHKEKQQLLQDVADLRAKFHEVSTELVNTASVLGLSLRELARIQVRDSFLPPDVSLLRRLKQTKLARIFPRSIVRERESDLLRKVELVSSSTLFNPLWYLKNYPDVSAAGVNPVVHYLQCGASEGRNPGPDFNAQWYLDQNPDVAAAGINPLFHYLEHGAGENRAIQPVTDDFSAEDLRSEVMNATETLRSEVMNGGEASQVAVVAELNYAVARKLVSASPLFDSAWYLETYPGIAAAALDPVVHYLENGAEAGYNPGPGFSAQWYLERNPDVAQAGANPLVHYLRYGISENRAIHPVIGACGSHVEQTGPTDGADVGVVDTEGEASDEDPLGRIKRISASHLFDPAWYLETYPDVAAAGLNPASHYLQYGAAEIRNPGPNFDARWYLRRYPDVAAAALNPLLHYLEYGVPENRAIQTVADDSNVDLLVYNQFADSMPLPVFLTPRTTRRITILTNGIDIGTLYGGVGTSLILATLLAKRLDAHLRLVTRRESPAAKNFGDILTTNGIAWNNDIEFLYAPVGGSRPVAVSDADIFLTTSWWTTKAVRKMLDPARIFYVLQEDERMFYPYGDERMRCEEVLRDSDVRFVVNTELLFRHLTTGSEACGNIHRNGIWFEPAFPDSHYFPEQASCDLGRSSEKKQFFFYARPNNTRNLYWRGLEALSAALESGVLDSQDWEFNFVGRDIGRVVLPGKAVVKKHQGLRWSEYAALVRKMDLALCLMDTPHPSYPPLDLAASGAVVVTNRHGIKTTLDHYSENILCANSDVEDLVASLGKASRLVDDKTTKSLNYSGNRLLRDWNVALEPVVSRMADLIRSEGQ